MRNSKKFCIAILTAIILLGGSVFAFTKFYDPYKTALSDTDRCEIRENAEQYYKALENGNYAKALNLCELNGDYNPTKLDFNSRETALEEVRKSIVTEFKFSSIEENISYDDKIKAYYLSAVIEPSYSNGFSTEELIYFRKVDGHFKIVYLTSCDRYAYLRVGNYKYIYNENLMRR